MEALGEVDRATYTRGESHSEPECLPWCGMAAVAVSECPHHSANQGNEADGNVATPQLPRQQTVGCDHQ